jgi:hypothetical protein
MMGIFSNKYLRLLALIFLLAVVCFSCKKENENPQWDVQLLAPIFKARLSVANLLADSIYTTAPDGAVNVVYTSNGFSPPVDSLFQFNDTLIPSFYVVPVPVNLNPGTTIYPGTNQEVDLDLPNGIELKMAIIKKGFAHLVARNRLHTKVIYEFKIPKATLNGDTFKIVQTVDSATSSGSAILDGEFDISGYTIDLTGVNGDEVNTLTYSVTAKTDPAGPAIAVNANDTLYYVETGFKDMVPLYGKGYLGQGSSTANNQSENVGLTDLIQSGSILLDSVKMTFTIKNSMGADAQAIISSFQSVNDRTGVTYSLTSPLIINHTININRASETAPPIAPVNSTYYSVVLDQGNSDIIPFIENIPSRINYSVTLNFNPLGNVSGSNDFMYTDSLFSTSLKLEMPLRFAASQLMFLDTVVSEINDTAAAENIGRGEFTVIAMNGFPYEMTVQLFPLNDLNEVTDTILVPGIIAPAPLNSSLRATTKERTVMKFTVDEAKKDRILKSKNLILKAKVTTSAYPLTLQVYSDYSLDLKVIGDVIYHVR